MQLTWRGFFSVLLNEESKSQTFIYDIPFFQSKMCVCLPYDCMSRRKAWKYTLAAWRGEDN